METEPLVGWAEPPRPPGHVFYDRLPAVPVKTGFDGFAETRCAPCYAGERDRPSLPPGRYFRRIRPVGYFGRAASERGLEWRFADSPSPRGGAALIIPIAASGTDAAPVAAGFKPEPHG